ncbi:hypothetical protein [Corynebacterium jeddahense]|uniref:Uncharacterized protein n=1 Tax=Corynebacterium jeddahense TaxID=1414719 RepID=A0ABY7ULW3_9CORY|nr:hypothetical protein [Corynebacterium jeddahense]WCZ39364.1 hypothetical protein CJEDD_08880 [Corynebacterium jeddahense]
MIFSFVFDDIVGFSKLSASAEEYDGIPQPTKLQFEFISPRPVNSNSIAAAGTLCFGRYIEGRVSYQGHIDRPVAEALQSYLGQPYVYFSGVDFRPKDPCRRPNIASLNLANSNLPTPAATNSFERDREFVLTFHDSSRRVGWSMELPYIDIPANISRFQENLEPFSRDWWSPLIAVVILIADAFEIGTIRIPRLNGPGATELRKVLRSIDMRLEVGE